jgi:hypothetical protein
MRSTLFGAFVAACLAAMPLSSTPAHAMALPAPAALNDAADALNVTEKVGYGYGYGYGFRPWRSYYRPWRPYYGYGYRPWRPYYGYGYGYGYRPYYGYGALSSWPSYYHRPYYSSYYPAYAHSYYPSWSTVAYRYPGWGYGYW